MANSIYAKLNNVPLSDYGIYVVEVESTGLISSPFLPPVEIEEDYAMNNDTPYYYGSRKQPLELTFTFAKLEGYWTFEARREFARLLDPDDIDDYQEFYLAIENEPNKIYYVKYIDGIDIFTNGRLEGYLTVHFRCNSPFAYSDYYTTYNDFSVSSPNTFTFINSGDTKLYPELWIEKFGNGNVSIQNITNAGSVMTFTGLVNGETIYIDNENGEILSSLTDTLRYSNHNGTYLELVRGNNVLTVTGNCKLTWKYNFKIKG